MSGEDLPRATVRVEWPDGRFFEYDFVDVVSAWFPSTSSRELVDNVTVPFMSIAFVAGKQSGYREHGLDGKTQTGFRMVET